MSGKYHGLPDIDTAPDIFETADEPEPVLRPSEDAGDDDVAVKPVAENIDITSLPGRRRAEKVYRKARRKPDAFRLRLPPLPRSRRASTSSSSSGSNHNDHPTSSSRPRESNPARLRRLKAELESVESELAQPPSLSAGAASVEGKRKSVLSPKVPVDLMSELALLKERMSVMDLDGIPDDGNDAAEWRDRLGRLTTREEHRLHPTGTKEVPTDQSSASDPRIISGAGLSELDERLAQLEKLIGPSISGPDDVSHPLLPTLGKLDHLLTLLTQPRHLDAISRRVKLLLVDLDRAVAASRSRHPTLQPKTGSNVTLSPAEYTELQTLFSLLPRLDPLLPILPSLLGRLRSLSGLHAEASEVAEGLKRLQVEDKRTEEEKVELQTVVRGVEDGLVVAARGIESNWEGLEARMRGLEGRIEALSG